MKVKKFIIDNNKELSKARIVLVMAVKLVIKKGLSILKINCPENM